MNDKSPEENTSHILSGNSEAPSENHYLDQYFGHKLTPEGRKELRWREGKEVEIDPLDADHSPLKELPKKFRDCHREMLALVMDIVFHFKSIKRDVPILREELLRGKGVDKQVIKDLIYFGYLHQEVISLNNGKRKMGGRAILTPTLEARKLHRAIEEAMRDAVEEESSKKESTGQEAPGLTAASVTAGVRDHDTQEQTTRL